MIKECEQEIVSALASDLHKVCIITIHYISYYRFINNGFLSLQSKFESLTTELVFTEGEIKDLLIYLKEWSADEKVSLIFCNFLCVFNYLI